MAKSNDLYSSMAELWESFQANHAKFSESGNKAAGTRARKRKRNIFLFIGLYTLNKYKNLWSYFS